MSRGLKHKASQRLYTTTILSNAQMASTIQNRPKAGQNSSKNMLDSQHRWQERYAYVLAHKQGIMAQLLNTIKE